MLSRAEQDLIRRDTELPGLVKLLDAAAFREALQADAVIRIEDVRLRYLRYKPGQNCLAAYTVNVAGTEVECHAKAYRHCDGAKLAKAGMRAAAGSVLGAGRFIWPETGIEVCLFPNDNKLSSLALVADRERREDFLQRHLPERSELWRSSLRRLAYKPERRWVGALEVDGTPRAVCKLYAEAAFETVRSKAKHFVPGEVLRLSPLLGRSKGRGALFFGWQPGELLSEAMLMPTFDARVLHRVGVALVELQRQAGRVLPERTNASDAQALLQLGEFLEFLLPAKAGQIRELASRLAGGLASLSPAASVVHGDFYAKQILFRGEEVTVLDLDEAARGDATDDLATFLAHLEREAIAGRLHAARLGELRAQLLAGYGAAGGVVDAARVELRTAARLFGRLPDFFRNHDPEWPQRTAESLERVAELLGHTSATSLLMVGFDTKLPAMAGALAPRVIESKLRAALPPHPAGATEISLQQVTLRRHKPGRRALIEYELELRHEGATQPLLVLGKLRRRGVDVENYAAVRELGETVFRPDSADEIAIPPMLGTIPELGLTLQQKVAGRRAAELLAGASGVATSQRCAVAIGKLHSSEILLRNTHTIADELNILEARLTALAAHRPHWESRLTRLMHAGRELSGRLHIVAPRPIHRDFYHDQVLLDGQRVWLLDLDLLCAGDPALDAGNFVGHLTEWGVRFPGQREALAAAGAAFTETFLEHSGVDLRDAVEIYSTLTLMRHVSISTQFPERAPFTEEILALCEERCGIATENVFPSELVPNLS